MTVNRQWIAGEDEAAPALAAYSHLSFAPSLEPGATTIMLRSLAKRVTLDVLRQNLDDFSPGKYDMVYLPVSSRKSGNISVAIINFVNHAAAKLVYEAFSSMGKDAGKNPLALVRQARIQGLAENLAYFVATAGMQSAMNHPHAPHVFQDGVPVSVVDAITRHVDMKLLAEATTHVKTLQKHVGKVQTWQSTSKSSRWNGHNSDSKSFGRAGGDHCRSARGNVADKGCNGPPAATSSFRRSMGIQSFKQGFQNDKWTNSGNPAAVSGAMKAGGWIGNDVSQSHCQRDYLIL
eukprot:TRINITY_DN9581_c0_g3_i1.p1 TRINITY_DN9581_c0_g3~~TRINITY_DN9581_c0_g3_i1.p1  ORF type:complete len:309 (+),score=60.09 TRINITY_DN9581_c0_g3_i1:55-927(+)